MKRIPFLPVCSCLLILAGAAGCASKNYSTSIASATHDFSAVAAKFRISHVDNLPADIFYMSGFTDDAYWTAKVRDTAKTEEFPRQLRELLAAKYPDLFSDSPDALRIDIRFNISKLDESSTASSLLAAVSWGLFGIVLPLPIAMKYDCSLDISFPDMDARQASGFSNRLFSWVSFPSPLALIPVPAPADRRGSVLHPLQSRYYSGRLFTLECFGEAVVQAVEKIDKKRVSEAYRQLSAAAIKQPPA